MARKLKSGIVGQAQVIFGGAIRMELGWVKSARGEELAIGMAELKHPAAKAGDPIIDEETYNGTQVTLVFPGFEPLNNFRYILDLLETELKKRIAERDAQQKIDFDDAAPSHLVHEHIDPPTFEEAKCEQKPTDKVEPIEWSGKIKSRKVKGVLKEMLDEKIKSAWSEEDEKIYSRICDLIHSAAYKNYDVDEDGNECGEYANIKGWFKKLKGRVQPQPKQEWSEEDKRKIDRIYSILRQAADTHAFSTSCRLIGDKECIELQDFLKFLKDRFGCETNCTTVWKPSDGQMAALMSVASGFEVTEKTKEPLKELFVELKKLREE